MSPSGSPTSTPGNAPEGGAIAHDDAPLGKSFGELAWRRLKRNPQALLGGMVILLMAAAGIYAPLLASRAPLVAHATQPRVYENAYGIVWFDTYAALSRLEELPEAERSFDAAFLAELSRRLDEMKRALAPRPDALPSAPSASDEDQRADAPTLVYREDFEPIADEIRLLAQAAPIDTQALLALLEEHELTFDFLNEGIQLELHRTWPALRSLLWAEVFFLVLYPLLLAGAAMRRQVGGLGRVVVTAIVLSTAVSALWAVVFPYRLDPLNYKELDARGELKYALWTPIPFGETEDSSFVRMPPWWLQFTPEEALAEQQRRFDAAKQAWQQSQSESDFDASRPAPALEDFAIPRARIMPVWQSANTSGTVYRKHWLGTDANGRDLLARMLYGARIAMSIGIIAVIIYCAIGITLGAVAGYFGGWVDLSVSRFIEVVICFPTFFLILIIISFVGSNIFWVMIVIGITGWTTEARLIRGEFIRLAGLDFVAAVRAMGGSTTRIIFRHILPNAIQPVIVSASFGIASAILIESSLSYLGFGMKPPYASWGALLHDAQQDVRGMWWMTVFPGMAIFLTVTAFNLLGDATRDALDPRLVDRGP